MNKPKVKDPFAALPEEFKTEVANLNGDGLNMRLAEVTKAEAENQKLKSEDQDLANLKEQAKEAGLPYSEATKANKLKVKFLIRVLKDKGLYKVK